MSPDWIRPDWPAPPGVRALTTTRVGGCSGPPYDSFNLGAHVGDDPVRVAQNRRRLRQALNLPTEPFWLRQLHGRGVVEAGQVQAEPAADAATTSMAGPVCAVLTADCLPLLLCNRSGDRVAAVHAGWRGLAAGVVDAALDRFSDPGAEILAWMGPAIGPDRYEVGKDVRDVFLRQDPANESAFRSSRRGHWLADLYRLAYHRLAARGLGFVCGGDYCTVSNPERFYSYRRDGATGRMASLIWLEPQGRPDSDTEEAVAS